jgi:hypothetical protein
VLLPRCGYPVGRSGERHPGSVLTSWSVRGPGLTDGQVVTLVGGLGLELLRRHAAGNPYGPIHPAHVRLDEVRRPRLVPVPAPAGWTTHDDWVSLLRLGRLLGRGTWASALTWESIGRRSGHELLLWVLTQRDAEPLPAALFPDAG